MTQIGEAIGIGMIDEEDIKCPFDHDEPIPPTVENKFIGNGGTLGSQMSAKTPKGTHLYAKIKNDYQPNQVLNPRKDPGHVFAKPNRPVVIDFKVGSLVTKHTYPVSCAAHHCIPAQESLKESPAIMAFMVKKGDSESIKGGSFTSGKVWSDVGYDVNGAQNGVYLPGSYAAGGGRGGMGVWASTKDGDDDAPDPPESPDPLSNELTGASNVIMDSNRKWLYVRQAVHYCPGQFHDRHADYSRFVKGVLDKIAGDLKRRKKDSIANEQCDQCSKRADTIAKHGLPTPYSLVTRLNDVSAKLGTYLNGSSWAMNIFTSKWMKAYMVQAKARNSSARIKNS